MTSLPPWADDRIEHSLDRKLTQRHLLETMLDAERPYLSAEQLRVRVDPDVSKETVRLRLNELRGLDVVATDAFPGSVTLYYPNHPASDWPLSPEGRAALEDETLSAGDFLRLRNPAGIRTLALAGLQLTLLLFALGVVAPAFVGPAPVESTNGYWAAGGTLLLVTLALLFAERLARAVREGDVSTIPRFGEGRSQ